MPAQHDCNRRWVDDVAAFVSHAYWQTTSSSKEAMHDVPLKMWKNTWLNMVPHVTCRPYGSIWDHVMTYGHMLCPHVAILAIWAQMTIRGRIESYEHTCAHITPHGAISRSPLGNPRALVVRYIIMLCAKGGSIAIWIYPPSRIGNAHESMTLPPL